MTAPIWPQWHRGNPAGLLAYVQSDGLAELLPNLPTRGQSWSRDRMGKLAAVYATFAAAEIGYDHEPLSSMGEAQAIRAPDEILWLPRRGTCLDLAITFAGACLHAGLHPLLVICDAAAGGSTHALVVVWLGGDWPGVGGDRDYPVPGPPQHPIELTEPPRWPNGGVRTTVDGHGAWVGVDIARVANGFAGPSASFADALSSAGVILTDAAGPNQTWRWGFGIDVGRHHRPSTALAMPHRPAVAPLDAPYQHRDSVGEGPLAQLRARTQTVPFVDRGELDLLRDWCQAPDPQTAGAGETSQLDAAAPPMRIAVVEGVGGAGKTRLAAQLASQVAKHGWYAGFLSHPLPAPESVAWLARIVSPVLVVIDYVEAVITEQLVALVKALATRSARTVLVFTARSRGAWWDELDRQLTQAGIPRSVFADLVLDRRHPHPERLFSKAYRRFTATPDTASIDEPPPPPGGAWTTLDLVMHAWLAAHVGANLPASHAQLYEAIIGRELAHWAHTITSRGNPQPAEQTLRTAAAVVSLLCPTPTRLADLLDQADLSRRTGDPPVKIAELLRGLLAEPDEQGLALRPDPIADHLILTTFPTDPTLYHGCVTSISRDGDSTPRAPAGPGRSEAERFCDNLTRAGQTPGHPPAAAGATDLATAALTNRPDLWAAAFEVALNRGGAFVAGLQHLAELEPSPLPLAEINQRIPFGHSDLRWLALIAALRTRPATTDDPDPKRAKDAADALGVLAVRLSDMGRPEEALSPSQEAVTIYRRLAEANPGAYLPDLAGSLNNLGAMLSELGRRVEALSPAQEAVTIYRRLAEANPGAYLPDLAGSLNNLGIRLSELGRREEALSPAQEAVTIYRRLAEANPGAYLPDLAMSLNNLGIRLSELGRREEALSPAQEAVTIRRRLAEANPGAYLPDLAGSLNNLGAMLSELGRREEALSPAQEAVTIYRRLAEANPGAYLPNLAASLNNLGIRLSELGRREEALSPAQEAVTIYRRLAEANPGAYLPDLAGSLNNLGAMLSELGRREEALSPAQEAVTIYRRLAEANPGAYLPDLAMSLNNLGIRLSELGRREEALSPAQEAVTIYRRLAEANPGAYLPNVAMSLNNLGAMLSELGRREEALSPAQEAVTIYRRLAEANPGAYLPNLAASLNNLGAMLSELGRREEALSPAQEAVTIYRRLAEANPGAYLPNLAASLNNLGIRLSELGRREEALSPAQEAVTIYRRLAEANPGAYLPDLAGSLNNLGAMLSELGRREEALSPAQEAVTIYRRLAEANPGAYLPDLAMSLNNLGIRLSELGRREEALSPAQEAVTIYRRLAEANPGAYLPNVAMSLNNLGAMLSELGRREEALSPAQEAVTIYRRLAEANPGAYLPNLAASLNNLGAMLSELGRREEALSPAQEAVTIYRRLAEANPGAYLPNLAASLNNLGIRLSELGRREEALSPAQEAVTIRRRLAEANPGAYLPDLAGSLNNLGAMLSELGRREEALEAFVDTASALDPGPRAELYLTRASWRAAHPDPAGVGDGDASADLAVAVEAADVEEHPHRGAQARRAVRAALTGTDTSPIVAQPGPASLPVWATTELPDDVVDLLNEMLAAPTWADTAEILSTERAAALFTDADRNVRTALAALYSDRPALTDLLSVLTDIDEHGRDAVLGELTAGEAHARLLTGWLDTPTWTESRRYLRQHPGLLDDPRTAAVLETGSGDPVLRQHLAIARLAASMPLDEVYDIVLDTTDAQDAALAALDADDLGRIAEIWHAAPHLARTPFTGPYLGAVLAALTGQVDPARELIELAVRDGRGAAAGAATLRRLAERHPDHAALLAELADTLVRGSTPHDDHAPPEASHAPLVTPINDR